MNTQEEYRTARQELDFAYNAAMNPESASASEFAQSAQERIEAIAEYVRDEQAQAA